MCVKNNINMQKFADEIGVEYIMPHGKSFIHILDNYIIYKYRNYEIVFQTITSSQDATHISLVNFKFNNKKNLRLKLYKNYFLNRINETYFNYSLDYGFLDGIDNGTKDFVEMLCNKKKLRYNLNSMEAKNLQFNRKLIAKGNCNDLLNQLVANRKIREYLYENIYYQGGFQIFDNCVFLYPTWQLSNVKKLHEALDFFKLLIDELIELEVLEDKEK